MDIDIEIRERYNQFLAELNLPLRNPEAFIASVISRKFWWALKDGFVSRDELFHEAVVALWKAGDGHSVGFYWMAMEWWLGGYIDGVRVGSKKGEIIPFSQLGNEEAGEATWLTDLLLQSEDKQGSSVETLIDEIMRVVKERGLQGRGERPCGGGERGKKVEEKIRQIIHLLSMGYNREEIAHIMGYRDHSSVGTPIAALAKKLAKDERFQSLYGERIPDKLDRRIGVRRSRFDDIERAKDALSDVVPEDILEAAGKSASGEKLTRVELAKLEAFREQWGWLRGNTNN